MEDFVLVHPPTLTVYVLEGTQDPIARTEVFMYMYEQNVSVHI